MRNVTNFETRIKNERNWLQNKIRSLDDFVKALLSFNATESDQLLLLQQQLQVMRQYDSILAQRQALLPTAEA